MRTTVWTVAFALLALSLAPIGAADTETRGEMRNHPPRVAQVDGMPESVIPLAGGQREVTFGFLAMDPNGWQDVERAEVRLYGPDNATFLREANVTAVGGGNGASQWFNVTFIMWYYELPTNGTGYVLSIRVVDRQGEWGPARYADFEYQELSAIQIAAPSDDEPGDEGTEAPSLSFHGAGPGDSSAPTQVVIHNTGNVAVELELYGTDLVNADGHAIPVSALRHGSDPENINTPLTLDPDLAEFRLEPGAGSAGSLYWALVVPSGDEQYIPAGSYSGSVTINGLAA